MKKITALLLSFVFMFGVFCGCTKKDDDSARKLEKYEDVKLPEGIVATVNDTEISVDELKFYLAQYAESVYSQYGMNEASAEEKKEFWNKESPTTKKPMIETLYEDVLLAYINYVSLVNKATENGIDVTEDLEAFNAQEGVSDMIKHYVDTYGISEDAIQAFAKVQFMYEKYVMEHVENDERIQVSDEQLKEKFEKDYLKAQHILIMTVNQETQEPYSEEEKAKALETAKTILKEVKEPGADFKEIMLEKSEDPGSQQQPDGYVFTEGEMVTEFYEGTKAIKAGEISDIVETSYGYHIIKRLPLDTEKDMENLKDSITGSIQSEIFEEIVKEIKDEMTIKVDYDKIDLLEGILY